MEQLAVINQVQVTKLSKKNKQPLFINFFSPSDTKTVFLFRFLFVSLFSFLVLCFLFFLWSCANSDTTNNLFHLSEFDTIFSIFLFLRCLSDSRQKTADETSNNNNNHRNLTTNHQPFLPLEICLQKLRQIFHLKVFVMLLASTKMRNIRHIHMTKRDVLKTIGDQEHWKQRSFCATTKNVLERIYISFSRLLICMISAMTASCWHATWFCELTKDETNWFLLCLASGSRIQNNQRFQKWLSNFCKKSWGV